VITAAAALIAAQRRASQLDREVQPDVTVCLGQYAGTTTVKRLTSNTIVRQLADA
jgi:hypothetical protein